MPTKQPKSKLFHLLNVWVSRFLILIAGVGFVSAVMLGGILAAFSSDPGKLNIIVIYLIWAFLSALLSLPSVLLIILSRFIAKGSLLGYLVMLPIVVGILYVFVNFF